METKKVEKKSKKQGPVSPIIKALQERGCHVRIEHYRVFVPSYLFNSQLVGNRKYPIGFSLFTDAFITPCPVNLEDVALVLPAWFERSPEMAIQFMASQKGGRTVVKVFRDRKLLLYSAAYCTLADNYCRRLGIKMAFSKIKGELEKEFGDLPKDLIPTKEILFPELQPPIEV